MTNSELQRAGDWFVRSGIQETNGGVARYYRTDLARNAAISTEITGYAAAALAYMYRATGESRYLEGAACAGRYLACAAWDAAEGAFPFEMTQNGEPKAAYFFDTGIIVRGLMAVWRAAGDREFLAAAERGAKSMGAFASGRDYHPILMLPGKRPAPREARWSRAPGCYQLKSALAWRELADATGDVACGELYEAAAETALAAHREFLAGEPVRERVMDRLHAYCYFLEGLLPLAREQAATLAAGMHETARLLREIAPAFARSDVYAQLLRIRLYAAALGAVPLDEAAGEEEASALAAFESPDGGFWFGRKASGLLPYLNPVSTAFGAQALHMWAEYRAGRFVPDTTALI